MTVVVEALLHRTLAPAGNLDSFFLLRFSLPDFTEVLLNSSFKVDPAPSENISQHMMELSL
jgi:hypothetical protein